MKVRELIDLIRVYPDWDVDILVQDTEYIPGRMPGRNAKYRDVRDVTANEKNGNIIILLK